MEAELEEIWNSIPFSQIRLILKQYYENDMEVQKFVEFLSKEQYKTARAIVLENEEIVDILTWVQSRIDLHKFSSRVESFYDPTFAHRTSYSMEIIPFGLNALINEIKELVPIDEVVKTIRGKVANGNDLAHLFLIIEANMDNIKEVFEKDEVKLVIEELRNLGVDVSFVSVALSKLFA